MKPDEPWSAPPPELLNPPERANIPCLRETQKMLMKMHLSIITSYLAKLEAGEIEMTHEMAMESVKCLLSSLLFGEQAKG